MNRRTANILAEITNENLWATAIHESGHAIGALASGGGVNKIAITDPEDIMGRGLGTAFAWAIRPGGDVLVHLGGLAAEVAFRVGNGADAWRDHGASLLRVRLEDAVCDPPYEREGDLDTDVAKAIHAAAKDLVPFAHYNIECLSDDDTPMRLFVCNVPHAKTDRLTSEARRVCEDAFSALVRYMLRNRRPVELLARRLAKRRQITNRWPKVPQIRWRPEQGDRVVQAVTGYRSRKALVGAIHASIEGMH